MLVRTVHVRLDDTPQETYGIVMRLQEAAPIGSDRQVCHPKSQHDQE